MELVHKQGILLKLVPYSESDLIGHMLTKEGERLVFFAPKARVSRKRFGSCLDLFHEVEVGYVQAKPDSLLRLAEAVLIKGTPDLRTDMQKFAVMSFFGEVLLEIFQEGQCHPEFYILISEIYQTPSSQFIRLIPQWTLFILAVSGFLPDFLRCLYCLEPVQKIFDYQYDVFKGGLVCSRCAPASGERLKAPWAYKVTTLVKQLGLHTLFQRDIQALPLFDEKALGNDEALLLKKSFEVALVHVLGKPLKSISFLDTLLESTP